VRAAPLRLAALTVAVLAAPIASHAADPAAHVSGVVLSADPAVRTLYVANPAGAVYLVLAERVFAVGSRVSVRGMFQPDGWSVLATGRGDRLRRTGSASRVTVRGELGFVDVARLRFELGAHGQVVGEVRFPRRFAAKLVRQQAFAPRRTRVFALAIARGILTLRSLPS
jgi:hypothetical protein